MSVSSQDSCVHFSLQWSSRSIRFFHFFSHAFCKIVWSNGHSVFGSEPCWSSMIAKCTFSKFKARKRGVSIETKAQLSRTQPPLIKVDNISENTPSSVHELTAVWRAVTSPLESQAFTSQPEKTFVIFKSHINIFTLFAYILSITCTV